MTTRGQYLDGSTSDLRQPNGWDIAIIGMACRLPGASGPEEFWDLLADGRHEVDEVPADRFRIDDWYDPEPHKTGKIISRSGGFIDGVGDFDAPFFGVSPREAESMDPQHRIMLEVAWEAVEDAGIPRETFGQVPVGAFLAVGQTGYWDMLRRNGKLEVYALTGAGERSMLARRLAYFLDLRGPVATVDTACSSSLLAVHMSCQSLRTGECEMAFAGGVNLILTPEYAATLSHGGMLSPRGACRFGDSSADGYVRAEGAGVVLLKPLAKALRDGDRVHAVISGGAVMNDGASGLHLLNPGESAQRNLLHRACREAGVDPAQIDYVEAHGTGTVEGDQIELRALRDVVGADRPPGSPCLLGSVKGNIGHAEYAAGVAGLIKTALALRQRRIPATLHTNDIRPELAEPGSPLRLATRSQRWPTRSSSSRPYAGVSSFGLSGTSVHLIMTSAPLQRRPRPTPTDGPYLLPLSARTPQALPELAARYATRLAGAKATEVRDVCWSAGARRSHHPYRAAVVGDTPAQLVAELHRLADQASSSTDQQPTGTGATRGISVTRTGRLGTRPTRVVFVCPGQGSQWVGMARELLGTCAPFRTAMTTCDAAVATETGWSVVQRIEDGDVGTIDVLQPVLWAIEVALAAVWRSWGVEPDLVIGHSMGEVAAAAVTGALSTADAAAVICRRSRLLAGLAGRGAMGVVQLSQEDVAPLLRGIEDRVVVAAGNAPTSTVLAGESQALEAVLDEVRRQGVFARRVKVDVASHSPQVDPCLPELAQLLAGISPVTGRVPIRSTVTDELLAGNELDADYWVQNLRRPVQFAGVVQAVLADGEPTLFIELSPHPILVGAVREVIDEVRAPLSGATGSLLSDQPEQRQLLAALGAAYVHGCVPDWDAVLPNGRRVALPTYPWQHERYWLEQLPAPLPTIRWGEPQPHPLIGLPLHSSFPEYGVWSLDPDADPALRPIRRTDAPAGAEVGRALPGSVHLEAAVAAVHQISGPQAVAVENFRQHAPLRPAAGDRPQIRMELHGRPGGWQWRVTSWSDSTPLLLATGDLRLIEGRSDDHTDDVAAVRRWCTEQEPGTAVHADLARSLGEPEEHLCAVRSAHRRDGEALVRLSYDARGRGDLARYRSHPVALQTIAGTLLATLAPGQRAQTGALTLSGADGVRFYRQPDGEMWCHARLTGTDLTGDVRAVDASGRLVAELLGVRLRPLPDRESAEAGTAPAGRSKVAAAEGFRPSRWAELERSSRQTVVPQQSKLAEHAAFSGSMDPAVLPGPMESAVLPGPMESAVLPDPAESSGPDVVGYLADLAAGLLRMPAARIDPQEPLVVLGLDSLMSNQLARQVEARFDVLVPARDLLTGGTLQDLVSLVTTARDGDCGPAEADRAQLTGA